MDERNKKSTKKYIQNGRFESDFVCLENFIIELKRVNLLQAKTY